MATCEYCGEQVSMPYTCSLCGNKYDGKHRLPESHQCINLNRFQSDEYKKAKKSKKFEMDNIKSGRGYTSGPQSGGAMDQPTPMTNVFWQASSMRTTVILAGLFLAFVLSMKFLVGVFLGDIIVFLLFLIGIGGTGVLGFYAIYLIRKRKAEKSQIQTHFLFWPIGVAISLLTQIFFFIPILAFGYFTNLGEEKAGANVVKTSNYAYIGIFILYRVLGYLLELLLPGLISIILSISLTFTSYAILLFGLFMMIPWRRLDGAIFFANDQKNYFIHLTVIIILFIAGYYSVNQILLGLVVF